MHVSFPNLC